MSDNWNCQVSYKFGPTGDMLNIRGDSVADLGSHVNALSSDTAIVALAKLGELLRNGIATVSHEQGTANVVAAFGGTDVRAPANPYAGAVQALTTPTDGPVCPHGNRQFREGMGAKGPWKAWFCPSPKGTVGQCDAQWIR